MLGERDADAALHELVVVEAETAGRTRALARLGRAGNEVEAVSLEAPIARMLRHDDGGRVAMRTGASLLLAVIS